MKKMGVDIKEGASRRIAVPISKFRNVVFDSYAMDHAVHTYRKYFKFYFFQRDNVLLGVSLHVHDNVTVDEDIVE